MVAPRLTLTGGLRQAEVSVRPEIAHSAREADSKGCAVKALIQVFQDPLKKVYESAIEFTPTTRRVERGLLTLGRRFLIARGRSMVHGIVPPRVALTGGLRQPAAEGTARAPLPAASILRPWHHLTLLSSFHPLWAFWGG